MNFTEVANGRINIQSSLSELQTLENILKEVEKSLSEAEFKCRTDLSYGEVRSFLKSIQEIKFSHGNLIDVNASLYDLSLLNHLLNEGIHGVKIDNFEEKIGMPKKEVEQILSKIHEILVKKSLIDEAVKTSYVKSIFKTPDYISTLEANEYKVTFYFVKLFSMRDLTGIQITLSFMSFNNMELSMTNRPRAIFIKDLSAFLEFLYKYIEFPVQDIRCPTIPSEIFQADFFKAQVMERGIGSEGEEYIGLNFMFILAQSRVIIKPLLGIYGAITFNNIRQFVLSTQTIVTALSENA